MNFYDDKRLSFRAVGVMAVMLRSPEGVRLSISEMAASRPEGRDAIRTAMNELKEAGYVQRNRYQNAKGHWQTAITLHESI